jgi:biopolymer transport protein ExbD
MITQPLDLASKLRAPPRDFDVFFWANGALIVLFFALLGSRFVLAPGMPVKVGESAALELPAINSAMQGAASVVVSYRRDEMILFEGGIYDIREFRPVLEAYAEKHPGATLLVRADRQVSVQGFTALCDLARAAGFVNVLLATEANAGEAVKFVPTER